MDDLISRQAAIDATWFEPSFTDPLNVLAEVRDRLKVLPSAQPRKGAWIDDGQYAEGHEQHAYYCSQCEEHYIGWIGEFTFCPNCGSDMRG